MIYTQTEPPASLDRRWVKVDKPEMAPIGFCPAFADWLERNKTT